MAKVEWQAIERDYNRHTDRAYNDDGVEMVVIRVANLSTGREQKATVCRAFCPVCTGYLRALIWRKSSPLNLEFKMPLVDQVQPAAPPT